MTHQDQMMNHYQYLALVPVILVYLCSHFGRSVINSGEVCLWNMQPFKLGLLLECLEAVASLGLVVSLRQVVSHTLTK